MMKYSDSLQLARQMRSNQTTAEKFFWEKVRDRKFLGLKFNRQFLIQYSEKLGEKLYYIVDFYNFQYKIVIEIDGPIHKFQMSYDMTRTRDIEALGFIVIKLSNEEVLENWENVQIRLKEILKNKL